MLGGRALLTSTQQSVRPDRCIPRWQLVVAAELLEHLALLVPPLLLQRPPAAPRSPGPRLREHAEAGRVVCPIPDEWDDDHHPWITTDRVRWAVSQNTAHAHFLGPR